eukprot:CAMPEP_0198199210 /NCGR_PEP_ID=MMETSP1445-20131203/2533_1 /TAXON_ID=36898 /ORGANISM="Pyramimonas sp., Strain CCMP2087" /LENGTH=282 /DNA_ID=CAMNT_0043868979 /DNA_START=195 /DNA_END=1043 /DNA_ORIENTATION=+
MNTGESGKNSLEMTIRRKHNEIAKRLENLGDDGLEWYMKNATPSRRPHHLVDCMEKKVSTGHGFLMVELARDTKIFGDEELTPKELAAAAAKFQTWGVDAIALQTDLLHTPDGQADLLAVCERVQIPVLQLDWMLHPIQLIDSAEAGAAGVMLVNGVLSKGTPKMVGFCESLMIDSLVEIVNEKELYAAEAFGVRLFAINVSVGLALGAVPGIRESVASSLVQNLPFGAGSIVGVRSENEARTIRAAGADAILLKREAFEGLKEHEIRELIGELQYMLSGDD